MSRLLIVQHAPTPSTRLLAQAIERGARDPQLSELAAHDWLVESVSALAATAEQVKRCDGIVLLTPANFGYMSGALKHFFDSTFLEIGGALAADGRSAPGARGKLPFGVVVHGRYDLTGAVRSIEAITAALPWRLGAPVLEVVGEVGDPETQRAYDVGATIAALALGG